MDKPLVSIVVPVYKVERYLDKCVQSILNQSYDALEIILVDDGSPDNSGTGCDSYAEKDVRVKVIHKENGGLSDARNVGIEIARGEYILFIDSDDYVAEDIVEYLVDRAVSNSADISTILPYVVYENETHPVKEENSSEEAYLLTPTEALNDALYSKNSTLHAWGKLYKRTLFESVRFPVGMLYEDAGTTYKLIARSKTIVVSSVKKYYYLQRRGSIINSGFYPKMMDSLHFAHEMLDFAETRQPGSVRAARAYVFMCAVAMLEAIVVSGKSREHSSEASLCGTMIKLQRASTLFNSNVSISTRLYALIATCGLKALAVILKIKHGVKGIIRRVK